MSCRASSVAMVQQDVLEALDEVHDSLTQTIKQVAHEPSVGLFFVQQHVHKAVPALLDLKSQLADASIDVELSIADAKDALNSIKAIQEIGPSVIGQMIKTLNSTCSLMPTAHKVWGSTSRLFPTPTRPMKVTKTPLRTTSDNQNRNNNMLANKQSMSSRTVGNSVLNDTKGQHASTSAGGPYEAVHPIRSLQETKNQNTSKMDTDYNDPNLPKWEVKETSDNFITNLQIGESGAHGVGWKSDISESPTMSRGSKDENFAGQKLSILDDINVENPACYIHPTHDSALSKAETVSSGSARICKDDNDNQIGGKIFEKRNWLKFPRQGFLSFGGKSRELLHYTKDKETVGEREAMSLDDFRSFDFEQFQAERSAKLESWLSESDGDALKSYD